MVIYKTIDGLSNYEIGSDGTIKSKISNRKQKILKPYSSKTSEYLMIRLINDEGKRKNYLISRLVAIAFVANPNNLPEVNHKDKNILNNDYTNLEWCDRIYNLKYSNVLDNPVKNFSECVLIVDDKQIKSFKTLNEAIEYTSTTYNVSKSSLSKYKHIKNTTIYIKEIGNRKEYNFKVRHANNKRETVLIKDGVIIKEFESRRAAARYAAETYGASQRMLEQGYETKGFKLLSNKHVPKKKYSNTISKSATTNSTLEDELRVEVH